MENGDIIDEIWPTFWLFERGGALWPNPEGVLITAGVLTNMSIRILPKCSPNCQKVIFFSQILPIEGIFFLLLCPLPLCVFDPWNSKNGIFFQIVRIIQELSWQLCSPLYFIFVTFIPLENRYLKSEMQPPPLPGFGQNALSEMPKKCQSYFFLKLMPRIEGIFLSFVHSTIVCFWP